MTKAYEDLIERIEIREYLDKEIPVSEVKKILEAARLSPSARNMQKWKFVVIKDQRKLEKLSKVYQYAQYVADASFAVAMYVEDYKFDTIDAVRAITHMQLAAWMLKPKVGSCFNFGWNESEVANIIGSHDPYKLFTIIPFGYPKKQDFKGKKARKDWNEVIKM